MKFKKELQGIKSSISELLGDSDQIAKGKYSIIIITFKKL